MVDLGKITRNLYCKRELRILVSGRLKTSPPSPKGPFFFLLFCYLGSTELSVEASSAVSTRRPSKTSVVACGRPKRHLAVAGLQACVSEWASCRSNAFDLSPSGSVSSFESVITCVWLRSPSCVGPGGARRKEGTSMLHRVEKVVGTGVPRRRPFAGYPCSSDTVGAVWAARLSRSPAWDWGSGHSTSPSSATTPAHGRVLSETGRRPSS